MGIPTESRRRGRSPLGLDGGPGVHRRLFVAGTLLLLLVASTPRSDAQVRVVGERTILPGLKTFLVKTSAPSVAYFAQIDPGAPVRLKVSTTKWPADNRAPTSYLCRGCLVAVNGGFFNMESGLPVAGQWPSALSGLLDPKTRSSVHGVQWLRKDGTTWPFGEGGFTLGRHPRTFAFGDKHGRVWFASVDGRRPGHSVGMSLPEVVTLAKSFAATWVVNLDGGCSSTFVVSGVVKNRPCKDATTVRGERPVANAFVVLPRD